jgi:hypothetical protein
MLGAWLEQESPLARAEVARQCEQAERERAAQEQLDKGIMAADPYGSDYDQPEYELEAENYYPEKEDDDRKDARKKLDDMFGRILSCGGLAAPLSRQAMYG